MIRTGRILLLVVLSVALVSGCSVLRWAGVPVPPEKTPLPPSMEAELEGPVRYPDLADMPPLPVPVTTPEENRKIIEELKETAGQLQKHSGRMPHGQLRSGADLPTYFKPRSVAPDAQTRRGNGNPK